MNDPSILFVKPEAVSPDDKAALKEAGVIVVEIDNPREVKLMRAAAELSSTELLNAAAKAIAEIGDGDYGRHVKYSFANAVCAAIQARKAG